MLILVLFVLIVIFSAILAALTQRRKNREHMVVEDPSYTTISPLPKIAGGLRLSPEGYIKNYTVIRTIGVVIGEYDTHIASVSGVMSGEKEAMFQMIKEAKLIGANSIIMVERNATVLESKKGEKAKLVRFICKGKAVEMQ